MLGLEFSVAEVSVCLLLAAEAGDLRYGFMCLLLAAEAGDLRYDIASFVTFFF